PPARERLLASDRRNAAQMPPLAAPRRQATGWQVPPDPPRARRPLAHGRRDEQQGDRAAARPAAADREEPHPQHLREAGGDQPRDGGLAGAVGGRAAPVRGRSGAQPLTGQPAPGTPARSFHPAGAPWRMATSPARIASAISAGVWAPMSRPTGLWMREIRAS